MVFHRRGSRYPLQCHLSAVAVGMLVSVGRVGVAGRRQRVGTVQHQSVDKQRRGVVALGIVEGGVGGGAVDHFHALTLLHSELHIRLSAPCRCLCAVGLADALQHFRAVDIYIEQRTAVARGVVVIGQQRVFAGGQSADGEHQSHLALLYLRRVVVAVQPVDTHTVAHQFRVFVHTVLPPLAFQRAVGGIALYGKGQCYAVDGRCGRLRGADAPSGVVGLGLVLTVVNVNALCLSACRRGHDCHGQ